MMSMAYRPRVMKIAAICNTELEPFFKILGIDEICVVRDGSELRKCIDEITKRKDIAIVVVPLRMFEIVQDLVASMRSLYPIFLPVPEPQEVKEFDVREFYRPIIRKYVGFEVVLGE